MNYYNEFDPGASAWLSELVTAGLIPKWIEAGGSGCNGGVEYPSGERCREKRESKSRGRVSGSFWSNSSPILCRDGKTRRIPNEIEPGIFGMADGISADLDDCWPQGAISSFPLAPSGAWKGSRVGLLRGYGNAIVPELAAVFIRSFMEVINESSCM